jgi:hypothetical protein
VFFKVFHAILAKRGTICPQFTSRGGARLGNKADLAEIPRPDDPFPPKKTPLRLALSRLSSRGMGRKHGQIARKCQKSAKKSNLKGVFLMFFRGIGLIFSGNFRDFSLKRMQ